MLVKSMLLSHHDTTRRIWVLLQGLVMRLCFQAGYHRDPGNNTAISSFDCEMRRRVWMFACEYDVLTSYQLGMTSLINHSTYDTAPPANLLDSDFSMDSMPSPRPADEYTPILFEIRYSRLVALYGDAMSLSRHDITSNQSETRILYILG